MNTVLPSTVEDINRLQQNYGISAPKTYSGFNKGFENIEVEKRYKREVSLPDGLKNWDLENIQSYLNFEEEEVQYNLKAVDSQVVPQEDDSRLRCDSFSSSIASGMDDRIFFSSSSAGLKTISTICMDSGSTCISAADSFVSPSQDALFRTMDPEETYQNLEGFLQQVPEMTENLPSPFSGGSESSSFDMPVVLPGNYFLPTQDSFSEAPRGTKRPASTSSEDDIFGVRAAKQPKPRPLCYNETRHKNNISSKNCRKTRKEKQKEMEVQEIQLLKENSELKVEVQVLEQMVQAHKLQIHAILNRRL